MIWRYPYFRKHPFIYGLLGLSTRNPPESARFSGLSGRPLTILHATVTACAAYPFEFRRLSHKTCCEIHLSINESGTPELSWLKLSDSCWLTNTSSLDHLRYTLCWAMSRSEDPGVKRGPIWSSHGWSFWTSVNLSFWHWNIGLMSEPTEEIKFSFEFELNWFFIPLFFRQS